MCQRKDRSVSVSSITNSLCQTTLLRFTQITTAWSTKHELAACHILILIAKRSRDGRLKSPIHSSGFKKNSLFRSKCTKSPNFKRKIRKLQRKKIHPSLSPSAFRLLSFFCVFQTCLLGLSGFLNPNAYA